MTETGRIQEISGDWVTISLEQTGACLGCTAYEGSAGSAIKERRGVGCGLSGTGSKQACRPNQGLLTALNRKKLSLSPGQRVTVEFSPASVLIQILTALLPPFLGFIAGYALGGLCSPSGDQALRAAAGTAGLFISAGIVYFIRQYLPLGKPTVVYYNQDMISGEPVQKLGTGY
jgi:positive regulator of sigma E activity